MLKAHRAAHDASQLVGDAPDQDFAAAAGAMLQFARAFFPNVCNRQQHPSAK